MCVREREGHTSQRSVHPIRNRLNRGLCVCVWERERVTHHNGVYIPSEIVLIAACVKTHASIITVSVTWLCSPFGLGLIVKLRTLSFILKAEARDYGKRRYISCGASACGVQPITMYWVSWPIRADCACRKEGLCRKLSVWERRGIIGPIIMFRIWKRMCFF